MKLPHELGGPPRSAPPGRRGDALQQPRPAGPAPAFTLLELLVVVGIIALLAALALVHFQLAHVRAQLAAGKANLRTVQAGIAQYRLDWNRLPRAAGTSADDPFGIFAVGALSGLTTPVAYVAAAAFADPFGALQPNAPRVTLAGSLDPPMPLNRKRSLFYFYYPWFSLLTADPSLDRPAFCTASVGPDARDSLIVYYPFPDSLGTAGAPYGILNVSDTVYDPTNGTLSRGDLAGFGGELAAPPLLGGGS